MVLLDAMKVLLSWVPFTFSPKRNLGNPSHPELSALLKEPWLEKLATNTNIKPVLGAARMLAEESELPDDHLFTSLLKTGNVEDMLFLFDAELQEAHLVVQLGRDVCGHEKVVHGGLTGSICDETFGALIYALKQIKTLGPEPAVTANLNVNYRRPIPTKSCLLCSAKLVKQEGRKLYMSASVTDGPTGAHLADATCLFVTLKPQVIADKAVEVTEANGLTAPKSNPFGILHLEHADVAKWQSTPQYDALCSSIGL